MIDWSLFPIVTVVSIGVSVTLVVIFSLGIRLLASAGFALAVEPKEFTDQITLPDEEELKAAKKLKKKLQRKLTVTERRLYVVGAIGCFVFATLIILSGLILLLGVDKHLFG